jgi:hypothetical protein
MMQENKPAVSGYPAVVRMGTVADFKALIPVNPSNAPNMVFLNLTHKEQPHPSPYHRMTLMLSAQAQNGMIATLTQSVVLWWGAGADDKDQSVREAMHDTYFMVREYLTVQGYTVLEGQIAVPDNVQDSHGTFEVVKWIKETIDGVDLWHVERNDPA